MLTINESCIGCGICVEDCPAHIIALEEKKPVLIAENCIRCGHCSAVCPKGALKNELMDETEVLDLPTYPVLDGDTAELFLKSRRSIRCFKKQEVSKEETERLLDIGRYAQTGSNSQGVSYMVLSTEIFEQLRELTMAFYQNQENPIMKRIHEAFVKSERDMLFRGAPMCILALTDRKNPYTAGNGKFALTYIELLAPSLGLGTCWAGYLERYLETDSDEVRALLNLPDEYRAAGALLYGYPKYRYYKTAARNEAAVLWR